MQTFIDDIIDQVMPQDDTAVSDYCFVFPGKRAGNFLKDKLKAKLHAPVFAPKVLSIEDLICEITGLKKLDNINTLFRFYETYKKHTPKEEQEDFETFYGWAQTLIYDFNEIDRYLIDTDSFFNYLASIKDLEHCSMQGQQTELIKKYLKN